MAFTDLIKLKQVVISSLEFLDFLRLSRPFLFSLQCWITAFLMGKSVCVVYSFDGRGFCCRRIPMEDFLLFTLFVGGERFGKKQVEEEELWLPH